MKLSARTLSIPCLLVVVVIAAAAMRPKRNEPTPTHRNPSPALPALKPQTLEGADDNSGTSARSLESSSPALTLVGTLVADRRAALSVVQPARIVAVTVREGEAVRRGQVLIRLDEAQGRTQTETAQAGLTVAEAQAAKARTGREAQLLKADSDIATAQSGLRQAQQKRDQALLARDAAVAAETSERTAARENVHKAQAAVEHAQQLLHSLEELAQVGGVARNDLQGARTQLATATSDLTAAQAQERGLEAGPGGGVSYRVALAQQDVRAAQEGVRQARMGLDTARRARHQIDAVAVDEIRAATAGVGQASAGLKGARALSETARLVSPIAGLVSAITAHTGETAQPGGPLLTVVSPQAPRVEALALARQLPRLHPGQTARILLDTRPDRPLTGRLDSISQVAEPDGRSFRVRFHLIHPPHDLRLDQSVRIVIPAH